MTQQPFALHLPSLRFVAFVFPYEIRSVSRFLDSTSYGSWKKIINTLCYYLNSTILAALLEQGPAAATNLFELNTFMFS